MMLINPLEYYTPEQIAAARVRLAEQEKRMRADGYCGDWGGSLESVVLTYGPVTWQHLFTPDKPHPMHEEMKVMGFFTNTHAETTK